MTVKLLIMMEGDFEGIHSFATKAEADAFESGFGMAAGLLGGPSWYICTKVDDGKWTIEDQEDPPQAKRLTDAIEQAKKRGHDV